MATQQDAALRASTLAMTVLRESELLRECPDTQLESILARSAELTLAPGALLFGENDVADAVWLVLQGTLAITKGSAGDEVIIDQISRGALVGEISFLTRSPAAHCARAKHAVRVLRIPGEVFKDLLHSCQGVAVAAVRTMADRVRRIERVLDERERLATLGTMAAGLAHELNNPAAAVKRATVLLKEQVDGLAPLGERLASRQWSPAEVALLGQLETVSAERQQEVERLDALARSDREDAVGRWLDDRGIERAWELAPVLVERGVTADTLESVMKGCNPSAVTDAIAWAERLASIRQLLDEVLGGTMRIAQVVKAVKAYSYADKTTLRTADVHEPLENSLIILGHKLREVGATVERKYDRDLPPIEMYGTELGQVRTNLLDNAADAMAAGRGAGDTRARRITVVTRREGEGVAVEIDDRGPGIAAEVLSRIFDPFFTTKDAGKGTGLGLDIAKRIVTRHGGTIRVTSVPGDTRFTVWLPVAQAKR